MNTRLRISGFTLGLAMAVVPPAAAAPGGFSGDLVYTPVTPCRLIDTRQAGGSLAPGAPRDFKVAGSGLQIQGGNPLGCGIPVDEARAAVINFVAVNPTGLGNLRAWAYSEPPEPPPNASVLNYAFVPGTGLNIANAIVLPICDSSETTCSGLDIRVQADVSGTHLVADVVGFFSDLPAGGPPPGTILDYMGKAAPAGYLLCDGSEVSRGVYARLFAAMGTAFGAGDGSTTFNLPDFRSPRTGGGGGVTRIIRY